VHGSEPPVPIHGTVRGPWPGSTHAGDVDPAHPVLLTAWLRPRRGGELDANAARALGATPVSKRAYVDRAELARATDAHPDDIAVFRTFCARHRIEIADVHWRSLVLRGTIGHFVDAFGAKVTQHAIEGQGHFRHRSGGMHAPPAIAAITRGVFGLHQWPPAVRVKPLTHHGTPLTPGQVSARYGFPDADGTGQTIGIVQCHGKFQAGDFLRCMADQGIAAQLPEVVRVDGSVLDHRFATSSDLEAALDTQVAAALAPGARIVIYEGPNDERGLLDAIRKAVFDVANAPSILSISYGWAEMLWTRATLPLIDDLLIAAALVGMSVFCASGDDGAELDWGDGRAHVLAPASSPFAIACGATKLVDGEEVAWQHSGGGFSENSAPPPWHATDAGGKPLAGRGVPDVAALNEPGYLVYVDGVAVELGGTSAVAPVLAALTARINQRLGKPAGFFAPLLYAYARRPGIDPPLFRDVTSGGNARYKAHAGWNPCTGLGVPNGAAIEAMLRA